MGMDKRTEAPLDDSIIQTELLVTMIQKAFKQFELVSVNSL